MQNFVVYAELLNETIFTKIDTALITHLSVSSSVIIKFNINYFVCDCGNLLCGEKEAKQSTTASYSTIGYPLSLCLF